MAYFPRPVDEVATITLILPQHFLDWRMFCVSLVTFFFFLLLSYNFFLIFQQLENDPLLVLQYKMPQVLSFKTADTPSVIAVPRSRDGDSPPVPNHETPK